jgi:predicted ArsR family transcriptional regulator
MLQDPVTERVSERVGPPASPVPDADHGRDRVAASLLSDGPATASMLAERLGISATAVRRHLDSLCDEGLAVASDRPPFGPAPIRRRGRPARTFSLTAAGRSQFPSEYDALARQAIAFLAEVGGTEAVNAFAEERAAELEASLLAVLGESWRGAEGPDDVAAFADALSDVGFAGSAEPAPTGVQVCQHHCPVAHVAHEFPQLCEAETEAFARVLGRHVQRLATIAHGDGVCTTVVPLVGESPRTDRPTSPIPVTAPTPSEPTERTSA